MSDPTHCRIRRVHMKGGADLTVLRRPEINTLGSELMMHARGIAASLGNDTAGYFVIAWDSTGAYMTMDAVRDDNPIPASLFPAWLEEIVRREVVTQRQIDRSINGVAQVEPPRPLA